MFKLHFIFFVWAFSILTSVLISKQFKYLRPSFISTIWKQLEERVICRGWTLTVERVATKTNLGRTFSYRTCKVSQFTQEDRSEAQILLFFSLFHPSTLVTSKANSNIRPLSLLQTVANSTEIGDAILSKLFRIFGFLGIHRKLDLYFYMLVGLKRWNIWALINNTNNQLLTEILPRF